MVEIKKDLNMSKVSKALKYSVLAMGLVAGFAHAADDGIVSDDGGIELAGHVYTGTCYVTVDGQDATATVRPQVTLPSILTADVGASAVGALLGGDFSRFKIEVSKCGDVLVPKAIAFNQGIYGVDSNGIDSYKNSLIGKGATPVATGVGAAMVLPSAPTVAVTFGQALPLVKTSATDDPFVGNVEVGAQFIKTAATVGSGIFTSVATFDIVYN
jgi:type 1 fimbria pilin